jgi:DNA-binding MurR/RpiR family transcriptional regulator
MTPAERQVAEYLRANSRSVIFATAEQIAAEAGTSDATVVRTARTLGYAGLLELRHSLTTEVVEATSPSTHLRNQGPQSDSGTRSLLEHVFAEATERLDDTMRLLVRAEDQVANAVDLIAGADETVGFGVGPSELVADYLALRLRRIGRRARATGATGFRLADDLLGIGARDVVVLYAPSRLRAEIEVVLDHAAAVGARSVLVSDSLGAMFADRVDVALPALHTGSGFTGEGLTSQTLTDVLVLGVAAVDEDRTTAHTELLTALRSELSHTGGRSRPSRRRPPSDRQQEESP